MLEGRKVTKHFGGLAALEKVDFRLGEGDILGLIGPNGSGKTTLFNCITGVYRPTSGEISFEGRSITRLRPHMICKLGIGRTYQIMRPFLEMTALENVMVGAMFGSGKRMSIAEAREESSRHLDFIGILDKKDVLTKNLTLVDRKMIEVARALATDPRIILLDEVVAGLNPTETVEATNLIKRIRDELGITVFWIEHVMKAVMGTAERIIVLQHGEKIAEGPPKEIAADKKVIDAYLGEKYLF